jgi:hypothetical protein
VIARVTAVVAALVATLGAPALADPLDELGFGAAASGMAGSRTAMTTGAEAAHGNPAGVALVARPEVLGGWQYAHHRLELDGADAGVSDANGVSLGLAVPFDLGEVHLAAGLALYLPNRFTAQTRSALGEPQFVRLGSALQRPVVEPVVAASFGRVAVGVGASLLFGAQGDEVEVDLGDAMRVHGTVDADMPLRAAPLAGVWWRPVHPLELAVTVRGELARNVALDMRTNLAVADTVFGDAVISVRSLDHATPMRAALAAALHPHDDVRITGEVAFERWRALDAPVPDVRVLVSISPDPTGAESPVVLGGLRNIVTSRLGLEWQTGALRLRAGGAYLPAPIVPQTTAPRFADGARTLATLGGGVRIPPGGVLLQPIDVDLALGWQHVMRTHAQPDAAFSSGGNVIQGSLTTTLRF